MGTGVTVRIAGVYNGMLATPELNYGAFVLTLPITLPIDLALPAADLSAHGARYRLIIDPSEWLYDEDADEVLRLDHLIGRTPSASDPVVQRIAALMAASIRLEQVD